MQDSSEFVDVKRFVPTPGQRLVLINTDQPHRENVYYICVKVEGDDIVLQEARLGYVVIHTLANIESHGAELRPLQAGERMPRAKQPSRKCLEKQAKAKLKAKGK